MIQYLLTVIVKFSLDDKCAKPGEYSSDSSISESDLEEEQKKISSLDSATSFRLKLSKCSLKEESPLPLLKSLFVNKPPTLYFTTQEEQGKMILIHFITSLESRLY